MKKIYKWTLMIFFSLIVMGGFPFGQPRFDVPEAGSYLPGEKIDPGIFVYDSSGTRVMMRELLGDGKKVVILSLLGGAAEEPVGNSHRGNLWCEDSFDDLAVQRALAACFKDQPVRFVAVAIPAVLKISEGQKENVYLSSARDDKEFSERFKKFIDKTEIERISTVLPFDDIYYDPKGRLILGHSALGKVSSGYGELYTWQGKFKWHLDPRTYGLPTVWVLTGDGIVAAEPFWGNDYDSTPPQINYGFEEMKAVVGKLLE